MAVDTLDVSRRIVSSDSVTRDNSGPLRPCRLTYFMAYTISLTMSGRGLDPRAAGGVPGSRRGQDEEGKHGSEGDDTGANLRAPAMAPAAEGRAPAHAPRWRQTLSV